MTKKKRQIEKELIVTNVRTRGKTVILDLRYTEPPVKELTERQLKQVIGPSTSQMEKMGREYMKGVMQVVGGQMKPLQQFLPPPNMIQISLSKQEYDAIGKPTVFDKVSLKLAMK